MALHVSSAAFRASRSLGVPLLACAMLAGCGWFGGGGNNGSVKPVEGSAYTDPNAPPPPVIVPGSKQDNTQQEAGAQLQVNKFLWRGALETLGFAPLVSADPFGGVIVTDWYAPPPATGERFKMTCYILGRELRTDGVKLTVFRQVKDGGQWVDAPVSPATAADIEGKILARARELRAAAYYK
jgi:hypothetical protein